MTDRKSCNYFHLQKLRQRNSEMENELVLKCKFYDYNVRQGFSCFPRDLFKGHQDPLCDGGMEKETLSLSFPRIIMRNKQSGVHRLGFRQLTLSYYHLYKSQHMISYSKEAESSCVEWDPGSSILFQWIGPCLHIITESGRTFSRI